MKPMHEIYKTALTEICRTHKHLGTKVLDRTLSQDTFGELTKFYTKRIIFISDKLIKHYQKTQKWGNV
jgi:hypothetical protein